MLTLDLQWKSMMYVLTIEEEKNLLLLFISSFSKTRHALTKWNITSHDISILSEINHFVINWCNQTGCKNSN